MSENLGRITVQRLTGLEPFKEGNHNLGFDVLEFWQWSTSDLVANTNRGVFAEYLVAKALKVDVSKGVRDGWAPYDLLTQSNVKVEVKSSSYLQSWHQTKFSNISFLTPKTRAWDPDTNQLAPEAKRQSDVYVFAILKHPDKSNLNPLDVTQWEFHVLSTKKLDDRTRSQHSITLQSLKALSGGPVSYAELKGAVEAAAAESRTACP